MRNVLPPGALPPRAARPSHRKSGKERLVREKARFGDVVRILGNFIRSPIL
jgi:hypothetical protein